MSKQEHIALLFFFIGISTFLAAQEKELYINYKYNRKGAIGLLFNERSFLKHGNIEVFSYGNKMVSIKFDGITFKKHESYDNLISRDTVYHYMVMDYTKGHLLISENLPRGRGKQFLLKEPLNLFEWKPSMDTKIILGYTCHKATCNFRGRDYVAWFARDIPFKAAPWKFHGLPGVILEVYSTDGYCSWVAEGLEIRPFKKEVEQPFYGWDIVDLDKFIQILKVKKQSTIEYFKRMGKTEEEIYEKLRTIEKFDLD